MLFHGNVYIKHALVTVHFYCQIFLTEGDTSASKYAPIFVICSLCISRQMFSSHLQSRNAELLSLPTLIKLRLKHSLQRVFEFSAYLSEFR